MVVVENPMSLLLLGSDMPTPLPYKLAKLLTTMQPDNVIYIEEAEHMPKGGSQNQEERRESKDVQLRKDHVVDSYYELQNVLGEGKFGMVYKCVEKTSQRQFAAKFIKTRLAQQRKQAEHELQVMRRLQHEHIVQLHDAFAPSDKEMVLIMELVEGGELFERVVDDRYIFTERAVVMVLRQICHAMAYVHAQGIIHLDLKPENILCVSHTGNQIKLIDFGLAQFYDATKELRVMAGTAEFVAPEVINFERVDYLTDMWSLGVITYLLLSGLSPFLGDTAVETYGNVTRGEWDFEPCEFDDVSADAKDFIAKLIVQKRASRMTAEECLNHPWLKRGRTNSCSNDEKQLSKDNLKRYVIRKRWKKMFNIIVALRRMGWDLRDFWRRPVPGINGSLGNADALPKHSLRPTSCKQGTNNTAPMSVAQSSSRSAKLTSHLDKPEARVQSTFCKKVSNGTSYSKFDAQKKQERVLIAKNQQLLPPLKKQKHMPASARSANLSDMHSRVSYVEPKLPLPIETSRVNKKISVSHVNVRTTAAKFAPVPASATMVKASRSNCSNRRPM